MPVLDRPVANDWPDDYGVKMPDAVARVRQAFKACTSDQKVQIADEILHKRLVHAFDGHETWRRLGSFRLASWIAEWANR